MSKIAQRIQNKIRTGQTTMGPTPQVSVTRNPDGSVTTSTTVRNGNGNGNGAPCGPAMPTQPQSWGAACPTGNCTADNLAANLNRAFAGERYPCREIPYWTQIVADAGGVAAFDDNSRVTICPTRVIIQPHQATTIGVRLSRFEVGNQNQVVGDPIPIDFLNPQSYVIIPFVTDCIKAGMPFGITIIGATADDIFDFGIIGPAIG